MKLLNYDFYDLQALIVFFREKPDCVSEYVDAIEQIISTLEKGTSGNGAETNTIRKILQGYVSREESGLSWIWTENVYTGNVVIIKEEWYYHILDELFREMLQCIDDSSRLYELCDAVHNLPTIMVENKKPEKMIKSVVKQIKRKG